MKTAHRYDFLRQQIPYVSPPYLLTVTQGIAALGDEKVMSILQRVQQFNDFNEQNDPWEEHDFGAFLFEDRKIFWKIDDYQGTDGYQLVLTVMLAEEY